jgi:hypothetical protein
VDAKLLTGLSRRMLKVLREISWRVGFMLGIWTSGYQSGLFICVSSCMSISWLILTLVFCKLTFVVLIFFRSDVIKMFSPFGKITAEDFLWHTRGPKQGEPRGYAFVQYTTKEVSSIYFLWQMTIGYHVLSSHLCHLKQACRKLS